MRLQKNKFVTFGIRRTIFMFTKLKGKLTAVALTFSLTLAVFPNCAIANENNSGGGFQQLIL